MQRNRIKRKLIDCAHFVPEDVASGDLSDSADFRISKLRIPNTGLGSPPSRYQQNKDFRLNWRKTGEAKIVWWLFWWLLVAAVVFANNKTRKKALLKLNE